MEIIENLEITSGIVQFLSALIFTSVVFGKQKRQVILSFSKNKSILKTFCC